MPGRRTITLAPLDGGGMRLDGDDGWSVELVAAGDGWSVRGGTVDGCRVARAAESGGFILSQGEEQERGRTTPWPPAAGMSPMRYLVLDDGRAFCMAWRGPREARYELSSWECPGAYLTARAADGDWRIESTVAGRELAGIEPILVLFATELIAADAEA